MNDVISVIIPIYNREKYLDKCIQSVLDQKDVMTEIILVDDGSSDSSLDICNRYAAEHDNIVVLHYDNHGVSYARNRGLDVATGDYVMFLDSDDRFAPGALAELQKSLEENHVDFVIGGFEMYSDDYELVRQVSVPSKFANKVINSYDLLDLMTEGFAPMVINIPLKLYKMDIWKKLRFPEDMKTSEDDYLLPTILKNTQKAFVLDKIIYQQTRSSISLVRSDPSANLLNASKTRLSSMDYIISLGKYDVALFRFGDGTRRLISAKRQLHTKEAKKEMREQYKGYCKVAKTLAPHVDKKNRIRLSLFRLNLTLYGCIRDLMAHKH